MELQVNSDRSCGSLNLHFELRAAVKQWFPRLLFEPSYEATTYTGENKASALDCSFRERFFHASAIAATSFNILYRNSKGLV